MDIFDIGEAVKARRVEKGLTQAALAEKAGISRSRITDLESGKIFEMRFGNLLGILNVLDLDIRLTDYNAGRPVLDDLLEENDRDSLTP